MPKSKLDFWRPKLEANHKRDDKNKRRLRAAGWDVLVLWECQLRDMSGITDRITRFLEGAA